MHRMDAADPRWPGDATPSGTPVPAGIARLVSPRAHGHVVRLVIV
jgi:hypothetical protein